MQNELQRDKSYRVSRQNFDKPYWVRRQNGNNSSSNDDDNDHNDYRYDGFKHTQNKKKPSRRDESSQNDNDSDSPRYRSRGFDRHQDNRKNSRRHDSDSEPIHDSYERKTRHSQKKNQIYET